MSWNPFSRGGSTTRVLVLASGVLVGIGILVVAVYLIFFRDQAHLTKQDKDPAAVNSAAATVAAKVSVPNAEVANLKVAGGFASAIVSDPTAEGQAKAGNVAIFRVNSDGSMTQLATGSSFSPIDLAGLGIPLKTQAVLTGTDVGQLRQTLASLCGYTGANAPGYIDFGGSFNSDGLQIDSAALTGLEQKLTAEISQKNATMQSANKTICVKATRNKTSAKTDRATYISTFTLEAQFITGDGELTVHMLTFATGPRYYRSYKLDGHAI